MHNRRTVGVICVVLHALRYHHPFSHRSRVSLFSFVTWLTPRRHERAPDPKKAWQIPNHTLKIPLIDINHKFVFFSLQLHARRSQARPVPLLDVRASVTWRVQSTPLITARSAARTPSRTWTKTLASWIDSPTIPWPRNPTGLTRQNRKLLE